jgi:predicted SpoU family rRNA methylase
LKKNGKHTDLTVYGVHEKIWNMIKIIFQEIDVLIGTPAKLNDMFSTAGYNVNRLKNVYH